MNQPRQGLAAITAPLPVAREAPDPRSGTIPVVAIGRPRLTASIRADGQPASLAAHRRVHGRPQIPPPGALTELIADARLRGRGGAGFPTARKLRTALRAGAGRAPDIVLNGAESEPASAKDRTLLERAPHLVLDGAQLLAAELGARSVTVWVHATAATDVLLAAVAYRRETDPVPVTVAHAPAGYLSGESSAALRYLNGGDALPSFALRPAAEEGPSGRPVLVNNVETVAGVALLAAHGLDAHRAFGTPDEPGTLLLTVHRASGGMVVVEAPVDTPVRDVLAVAQACDEPSQAVLLGGYFGRWLPATTALDARLSHRGLAEMGATLGAGVVLAMPAAACAMVEIATVVTYLAEQNAGQCGPCVNGLPAMARALHAMATGRADAAVRDRIRALADAVTGRGACRHPDGVAQFAISALQAMPHEVTAHLRGGCRRPWRHLLPIPSGTSR